MLRLSVGPNPQVSPGSPTTPSDPVPWVRPHDIPVRVAALLQNLDLQCADIVSVTVPSDPAQFGRGCVLVHALGPTGFPSRSAPPLRFLRRDMAALLACLEGLVASGHTQYYGVESAAFTVADSDTSVAAQPLRDLFELAEAQAGKAAGIRKTIVEELAAAGVTPEGLAARLGNTVGRNANGVVPTVPVPVVRAKGWRPPPLSRSKGAAEGHPLPDDHHLVCIAYPLNLGLCDALLPTVLDKQGK